VGASGLHGLLQGQLYLFFLIKKNILYLRFFQSDYNENSLLGYNRRVVWREPDVSAKHIASIFRAEE
jgi:hypothetical protein